MTIRKTIALPLALIAAGALTTGIVQQPVSASAATTSLPTGDVRSNGRTWHQSYREDFNTPAPLGSVLQKYPALTAYDGEHDTSGRGIYAPSKVLSVKDGNLDYWVHSENGQPLGATVMPAGWSTMTTGRVSIRYKTTDTAGYKFVGMLWPDRDDWNKGEIDWPEGDLGETPRPASGIPGSLRNGQLVFDHSVEKHTTTDTTSYHVATTEWDSGIVRFYWDGTLVSQTTKAVPRSPMRVALQAETAILGSVPRSSSGHVDVDWVSIWK
jgi:hypothetical protein